MEIHEEIIKLAKEVGHYSFDVEHEPGLNPHQLGFKLHGVSFRAGNKVYYETDKEKYRAIVCTLFPDPEVEDIAYNGKYDLQCLAAEGTIHTYEFPENTFRDPMVAINLLNDNLRPSELGLKASVKRDYRVQVSLFKEAASDGLDSIKFYEYTCDDAKWEYRFWKDLKPKLIEEGLFNVFCKILMPVCCVFAEMELNGAYWDLNGARKLLRSYQKLRDEAEYKVYEAIGSLNLNSGDQLAKRLFDELGYSTRGIVRTDSDKRYSVAAGAMETLAKRYPVCDLIRLFRTADKMIGTYIEPLSRRALDDPASRIHPTTWVVSATGRTRMEKPNLQNVPAWIHSRKDIKEWIARQMESVNLNIRSNFVATPGWRLLVADYSQIELRIIAHVSGDARFMKAYHGWKCNSCGEEGASSIILHRCPKCGVEENEKVLKGEDGFWHGLDLHQQTADKIHILKGDRNIGKTANFELVYLATAWKMNMEHPELTKGEWEAVIREYFGPEMYIGVKRWHQRMERAFQRSGVCTDIFGRKRRILKRDIARNYKHALNQFVNFIPQCSACQLLELALVKIRQRFMEEEWWNNDIKFVNFIHDELVFEIKDGTEKKYRREVRDQMELAVRLKVPIRSDIKIVDNWGEAKI